MSEENSEQAPPSQLIITFAHPGSVLYHVEIVGEVRPHQIIGVTVALKAEAETTIATNIEMAVRQQIIEDRMGKLQREQEGQQFIATPSGPIPVSKKPKPN